MNLTIAGHHLEVTPDIREYLLTKFDRVTRHFNQINAVVVLMSVEKLTEKDRRHKVEVTLRVKGRKIFVEQASEDMYAAINLLIDKLDQNVLKYKRQQQNLGRRTGRCGSARFSV